MDSKKHIIVKSESLINIIKCFSSEEEFQVFGIQLSDLIDEILFTGQLIQRNLDNQEVVSVLAIKQYFLFALFCKENIELIQQLIGVVDYTEVSKEEKDRFNEEHPEGNLDRFEQ